jgi:hypothetical protein
MSAGNWLARYLIYSLHFQRDIAKGKVMLVYDGTQRFEANPNSLHAKVNALNDKWELTLPRSTTPTRKLIYNRACALGLLIGINSVTYFAINAILSA